MQTFMYPEYLDWRSRTTAVLVFVLVAGALATIVPVRRAMWVDPNVVLKIE